MFPRDRVIASLTKYEIPFNEASSDDELREALATFYAKRSLTQTPIEPDDQAEAIFLLLSERLSKTAGHVIPVDGGLQDGFMR
jgi:NAD(P)-dependent dehydrogenase (short-subunit alcohol dehydrogenase family)